MSQGAGVSSADNRNVWSTWRIVGLTAWITLKLAVFVLLAHTAATRFVYAGF